MMLNFLVEGMFDAGAQVEILNLREKKVKNCIGCFTKKVFWDLYFHNFRNIVDMLRF